MVFLLIVVGLLALMRLVNALYYRHAERLALESR